MSNVFSRKNGSDSFLFATTFFSSDSPSFAAQDTLSATPAKSDYFPLATGRFRMFCFHTYESSQKPLVLSHNHGVFLQLLPTKFLYLYPGRQGSRGTTAEGLSGFIPYIISVIFLTSAFVTHQPQGMESSLSA